MPPVPYQTKTFYAQPDAPQNAFCLEIASWTYRELCDAAGLGEKEREPFIQNRDVLAYPGGWQSWSAGWELASNETLPRSVLLLRDLIKLTNRDGDAPKRGEIVGHFLMYLRAGDAYLCLASRTWTGGAGVSSGAPLPPVTFRINRKKQRVAAELFCPGKRWTPYEVMAELRFFACEGYFNLKDTLAAMYRAEAGAKTLDFLIRAKPDQAAHAEESGGGAGGNVRGKNPIGGYESWYNHYTNISEKLILEDLEALSATSNLIKRVFLDKGKPVVFQIDDGWEQRVGQWDIDEKKFPRGLRFLAEKIERQGLIPGLWIAPFIVTRKSKIFSEKYEWVLKDEKGKPVVAGFNNLWDGRYYCLDLSRDDTLAYIQGLIDRVIDWGFRYIKVDFLYAGFLSGDFAQGGSPYEHYERACALLTKHASSGAIDATKPQVAYLGCGLPLGASFRHFPLSRIGADTRGEWDWKMAKLLRHVGRPSAYINLLDTIGRSFFDGVIYRNDPDVMFMRARNCKLTENEKELIALVNFLLAGQIMISDDPLHLEPADMRLAERMAALYAALADDEYGAVRLDRDVFRLVSRSGKTTGVVNLSNRPYPEREPRMNGQFLVDRRKNGAYAPHSISIQTGISP
ncbi:MAG: alpha-galactosidase [Treponema sp.]|jgi:alpha-galactosidase|nr:alpha-galactosidase [Treponema sp.]